MLIATHDLDMANRLSSRAVLMNAGRIIKDAPTGSVLKDEALLLENGLA
jgi:ABC-type glutathione transport system ATPase component